MRSLNASLPSHLTPLQLLEKTRTGLSNQYSEGEPLIELLDLSEHGWDTTLDKNLIESRSQMKPRNFLYTRITNWCRMMTKRVVSSY